MYSPNFTVANKTFCLNLHYNSDDSYLFVNGKKFIKFKVKKQSVVEKLSLGDISANFNQADRKSTGLYGYIYDFSADYNAISNDKIHDIHAYLIKKNGIISMFGFIKKYFVVAMTFINFNLSNVNSLECVSMNNQECQIRTEITNLNTNESMFYPYSIKINKCKGSCNKINYPYAKKCIPENIKNTNVKVFNLMSRTNETRHIKCHKICKCRCGLDLSVCNNKQRWNEGKCRCECQESIDKGIRDTGFIWNPSNCECECDKSCDIGEYLGYKNCKCRKKVIDKLIEESSENIDENKMLYNETLDIISSSDNS